MEAEMTSSPFLAKMKKHRYVYAVCGIVPWGLIFHAHWMLVIQIFGIIGMIRGYLQVQEFRRDIDSAAPLFDALYKAPSWPPNDARIAAENDIDKFTAWFNEKYGPGEFTTPPFHQLRAKYDVQRKHLDP